MKMIYVLVGAIAAAAGFAAIKSTGAGAPPVKAEAAAMPSSQASHPVQHRDDTPLTEVEGDVLEVIEVQNYSYLRLGAKGTDGTWTAVTTADLKVGAHARVVEAMKMSSFKSAALGRTFDVIYFGRLEGAGQAPHGDAPPPAAPEVKPSPRAPGPNGKTVAEVIGQRTALAGKTVRVQGTVVKVTAGVMGKTYLHLRDGTGDAAVGTNDVTVTTTATPAVGSVIVVEGVVAIDRDIGSGYTFPTLVEEAKVVGP